jgi:hypothetical protein
MKQIFEMLQKAAKEHFWGQIQADFRDGEVVLLRRTETMKPEISSRGDQPQ